MKQACIKQPTTKFTDATTINRLQSKKVQLAPNLMKTNNFRTISLIFSLFIFIAISIASCSKDTENTGLEDGIKLMEEESFMFYESSELFREAQNKRSAIYSAPFEIQNIKQDAGVLSITVSYPDNCQSNKFDIIWNGLIFESYPPQTKIILKRSTGNCIDSTLNATKVIRINLAKTMGYRDMVNDLSVTVSNGSVRSNSSPASDILSQNIDNKQ